MATSIGDLLRAEMIKSLGCTEPAAVALAAAKAREVLGKMPQKILLKCSQNIIKNVQSVTIPNSGNLRGVDVAATLGCIAGKATYDLEVLNDVKPSDLELLHRCLQDKICTVEVLPPESDNLQIICQVVYGKESAEIEIRSAHNNIVAIKKNHKQLPHHQNMDKPKAAVHDNFPKLTFDKVYEFATTTNIQEFKSLLNDAIKCNSAIAEFGLKKCFGACVGRTILENGENTLRSTIKAHAAAGSDARMGGCTMPVIINSGSGNQGMTITSTILQFAKAKKISREKLYRALIMANLLATWQKSGIGKLSAFCGAISAAAAAGGAVTYLRGGTKEAIAATIINHLAASSGIFCDGAKPSCALKIATAVDCALTSSDMAMSGCFFKNGEGIVKADIEKTVAGIAKIAKYAMRNTDKKILKIMLEK